MKAASAIGALAFLIGCAPTTTNIQGSFQARSAEAAELRSIAIANFRGQYAGDFTNQLTSSLTSAQDRGQPYFSVTSNIPTQVSDLAGATSLGRARAVTGVYFGETTGGVTRQNYQEGRVRCIRVGDESCAQRQEYQVSCSRATANFTAYPKVVDVRQRTIRYAETVSGAASEAWCTDRIRAGTDAGLMGRAIAQAVSTVRSAVAPYTRNLTVEFKTRSPSLERADSDQFIGAVQFSQQGRLDRACAIWETMLSSHPRNVELMYNLGVCAEAGGNFGRALELYGAADAQLTTPDRLISAALVRARSLASGRESTGPGS